MHLDRLWLIKYFNLSPTNSVLTENVVQYHQQRKTHKNAFAPVHSFMSNTYPIGRYITQL